MSSRTYRMLTAVLPFAVAVACTKTPDNSRLQSKASSSESAPYLAISPYKPVAKPATPANPAAKKERRPLQRWGRYWLTD